MCKDYSNFIIKKLKKYSLRDFEIGKTMEFHIKRSGKQVEDIKKEILNKKNLRIAIKQEISGETRYNLYFVYNKRKGIKYTITFRGNKIRLITTIPLGRKTLKKLEKQLKRKFKKENVFNIPWK